MISHIKKTAIAIGISAAALLVVVSPALADGPAVTPTKTPTPTLTPTKTPTPKPTATPTLAPETRIECTTGSYGQQTCKTVVIERVSSPSGKPAHEVVNSGIAENIMFAIFGVFVVSSVGYGYSKVKA